MTYYSTVFRASHCTASIVTQGQELARHSQFWPYCEPLLARGRGQTFWFQCSDFAPLRDSVMTQTSLCHKWFNKESKLCVCVCGMWSSVYMSQSLLYWLGCQQTCAVNKNLCIPQSEEQLLFETHSQFTLSGRFNIARWLHTEVMHS